jgi:uncharacterized membrane protein YkoI
MKLSKVFLVSIFLTAIILVVIGGLVSNVFAAKKPVEQPPTSAEIQAYKDREAAYNQLVEQANQQLEKANQELKTLHEKATVQPQPVVNQLPEPSVAVSVEKASEIAGQVAATGQTETRKPELVDFEGKTAYEIPFANGSIYVDAQSGTVLFNGTIPQEVSLDMATKIAEDFLKNSDIVLADEITFRGAQIYRVIFKNSSIVYLDKTGQITYIIRNSMATSLQNHDNGGDGGNPPPPSEHEHEHDDHGDD